MPFAAVGTAVAGAVAGAGANALIGGLTGAGQSSAIGAGSAAANAAAQQALTTGATNYKTNNAAFQPYVATGQNALTQYANLEGLNGQAAATNALSSFQASPGYQYQVQQGLMGVDQGAAAQGILNSGSTLKAEQTLGSNLANQDFSNYTNRLSTLAGMGLSGAQGQNQSTATYDNLLNSQTNSIAGTDVSQGAANASIYGNVGNTAANATGTAINSLFGSGTTPQAVTPYTVTNTPVQPIYDTIVPSNS